MAAKPRDAGEAWKKLILILACLGLLVLLVAWVAGSFRSKIQPGQAVPTVQRADRSRNTAEVKEIRRPVTIEAIGTLVAAERAEISGKLMAEITAIHVRAGDTVSRGDVLIELQSTDEEARVRQAEEALAAAKVRLANAENDLERYEQAGESVAEVERDAAETRMRAAQAEMQRARQRVSELRAVLDYATIRAPQSGRVVDRLAEPGDVVQPGEPLLRLYDSEALRLEAPVPEEVAVDLKAGDDIRVYLDALGREVEGEIDEIVPRAQPDSRSVLVKAILGRSSELYEGMVGRLRLQTEERRCLCVAEKAIQGLGQLEFVDVLGDDGSVERRYVKTGDRGLCPDAHYEILSGLAAGEAVLLEGQETE